MLDQMEEIASDEGLQQVWRLRRRGAKVKPLIQAPLRAGAYRLGAVSLLASKQ